MRYLTLAADYGPALLRDEMAGVMSGDSLGLSRQLTKDINAWNADYQAVIPIEPERRGIEPTASLIRQLDKVGCRLAERISLEVEGGARVRYYSEGLLREIYQAP